MNVPVMAVLILAAFIGINRALEPRRRKESAREVIRRRNTEEGWPPETGGWI